MQNPSMISRKRFHFAHQPRDGRYSEASVFEAFLLPLGPGDIPPCIGDGGSLVIGRRLLEERPRF